MPDDKPSLSEEEQRQYVGALETLPLLTRTVFLLASRNSFPYAEIGWRCGISVDEVKVRITDALVIVGRYMDGQRSLIGRIRHALLPWRDVWATARAREGDRRLAPWFPPELRPGRRGVLDWLVWAFECVMQ